MESNSARVTVTIPTLKWPVWRDEVEGHNSESGAAPGSGLITFDLPSGENIVDLALTRTPARWLGEIISLFGVVILLLLVWPRKSAVPAKTSPRRRYYLLVAAGLLILFITLRLLPEKMLADSNLNWDFAQHAYLHHAEDGIPFENGAMLRSYEYSADEIEAGNELEIMIDWEGAEDLEVTAALTTPAANRFKLAPALVADTQIIKGSQGGFSLLIPENAPRGLYVPRVTMSDARSLTSSGDRRGDLFLRPVRVTNTTDPLSRDVRTLDARAIQVTQRDPETLEIQLQWATQQALTQNYNFSLRLTDAIGNELAQLDGQPGYGFQPSSLWPDGSWTNDWLAFPLPNELPRKPDVRPFSLIARLYDVENGEVQLIRRLGELDWDGDQLIFQDTKPVFSLPDTISKTNVVFGGLENGQIGLRGYAIARENNELNIILYWQALSVVHDDYFHFVHLVDPETGEIVAQHDSMPRNDSYPTSQWSSGEIVVDPLVIDLSDIVTGKYDLHVGLFHRTGDVISRLPATDVDGTPLRDDIYRIPEPLREISEGS